MNKPYQSKVYSLILTIVIATSQLLNGQSQDKIIKEFKDAIDLEFSKVVTQNTFSSFGNYAAISTADNSLAASINLLDGKKVWGVSLAGGATEGISELFKNGNPNSTFKGSLQLHLLSKTDTVSRNDDDIRVLNDQLEDKNKDLVIALNDLKFKKDSIATLSAIKKIDYEILKINGTAGTTAFKVDSLKYELTKNNIDKKYLIKKLKKIQSPGYQDSIETIIYNKFDKETNDLIKKKYKVGLNSFKFGWWSLQYKSQQTSFKNLAIQPDSEIGIVADTSYLSHEFSFAYSTYKQGNFQHQNVYTSVGASIGLLSNYDDLKKTTIESRTFVPGDSSQVKLSSSTAYEGDFMKSLIQVKLFFDYYKFFGVGGNEVAFHLNPTLTFHHDDKIITSFMIGALIPFKNSKSGESKINLEIFYKINDVFYSLGVDNALKNRNVVGITATVPINLLNQN